MPSEPTGSGATTNQVDSAQNVVQAGALRDVHFHGVGADLVETQSQAIVALQQLQESTRLGVRAAQLIAVLRYVLVGLAGAVLAEERALARAQLDRARSEEARARALADAAMELILTMGEHETLALPPELPVITSEEVMLDVRAGLRRVQRILDEQGGALDRLESAASPAFHVARLFEGYVDAPMPVALLSTDGRFLLVNEEFSLALGYRCDDLAGKRLSDIAIPWSREDNGHLVIISNDWPTGWYRIRRWPVSGYQIVVFEDDWERALPWVFFNTGLPNEQWLSAWFKDHGGVGSHQLIGCRVTYDFDAAGSPDHRVELAHRVYALTSEGRFVVQLDSTTFLLVVDARAADVDQFIGGVRPALEAAGAGVPFTLGVAECVRSEHSFDQEILHNVDTAGRWAEAQGRTRPWIVREPVFSEGEPRARAEDSLLFQPFVTGDSNNASLGVQVVSPFSVDVFRRAVAQLVRWNEKDSIHLNMEVIVTSAELRWHDWRTEFPRYSTSAMYTWLMLDVEPDFADYVLLRRFGMRGRAGVRSTDVGVRRRVYELGLHTFEPATPVGEPTDADGVVAWVTEYRKERSRRLYEATIRR